MIGEKEDEDDNNEEDEYPTDEQVYESVDTLTSSDIEFLRAAVVEGDESASRRTPFNVTGSRIHLNLTRYQMCIPPCLEMNTMQ